MAVKRTTLVYCRHGASRSASVLCGYLAWKQQTPPGQVLEAVKQLSAHRHRAAVRNNLPFDRALSSRAYIQYLERAFLPNFSEETLPDADQRTPAAGPA